MIRLSDSLTFLKSLVSMTILMGVRRSVGFLTFYKMISLLFSCFLFLFSFFSFFTEKAPFHDS